MSRKLKQVLGEEAEDLVTWMDRVDSGGVEWREAMRADFAEQREHLMEARFERRFSDLIKWSFVFWVGAVAAIAMLAGAAP